MYETLLVPLDGSKRAELILPHVEELARRYDARVVFLQVVEPPMPLVAPEGGKRLLHRDRLDHLEEQIEAYLTGLQGEFRQKGIEANMHVAHGPVVDTIIKVADREKADLIALASHGRSGLARVFYGSVAAGVLQRVDRPLLLVRSQGGE